MISRWCRQYSLKKLLEMMNVHTFLERVKCFGNIYVCIINYMALRSGFRNFVVAVHLSTFIIALYSSKAVGVDSSSP